MSLMTIQPATSSGTNVSVLVVEPDQVLRRLLHLTLAEGGYRVHSTGSASEALRLNEEFHANAVVVNWLPGLHPASLIGALRRKQRVLPAIIVTADRRSTAECAAVSDSEALEMPFWSDEFLAAIVRVMPQPEPVVAAA
jgi:DNA-binding response OmpR family regulator